MLPAEKLKSEGYILEAQLRHNELVNFILPWLSLKHRFIRFFFGINLLFLLLLLISVIRYFMYPGASFGQMFAYVSYGFALTIPLIPVHEFIHGMAYKYCGAKTVTYKANWRKMYFMAMADQFITGRRAFFLIGLAPFVLINLCLIVLAGIFGPLYTVMFLSCLVVHSGMCAGDFALISYFDAARDREVVTYDDVANQETFFYSRPLS